MCESWVRNVIGLRGLFKAGRYVDRACNSFVGGTMVETPDGPKRIELIEEGDWVLTRPQEQPGAPPIIGRVTGVFRNLAPVVLWLTLSTGQVVGVTPTHEFWTYECGWTLAGELHVGETLTGLDGQPMAIVSIVVDGRPAPVYNLEVEGTSTFFAQGVWVHNSACSRFTRGAANGLNHLFEILPYEQAQKLTRGFDSQISAHHILEVRWANKLGIKNTNKLPSVILPWNVHDKFTSDLAREWAGKNPTKGQIWNAYQKVYSKYPDWLRAIRRYFE
jgi:hypothetical protein